MADDKDTRRDEAAKDAGIRTRPLKEPQADLVESYAQAMCEGRWATDGKPLRTR